MDENPSTMVLESTIASAGARGPPLSAKDKVDASIMSTNNSCISSKRSVEKLYLNEEPGYFRHFVKKFQRRSPLINRGYWLRMKAIESVVRTFLEQHDGHKAAVVNLGCGYDPLPLRTIEKEPKLCAETVFVDVDYPQLINQKCQIIEASDALRGILADVNYSPGSSEICLRSSRYYAVSCDLEDLPRLDRIMKTTLGLESCPVLFLAEVSITYMDVSAADSVIEWASSFRDCQFCLLEQFLPDGPDHPFAETMLKHFVKLHSPLKSVHSYQQLEDQRRRFLNFDLIEADVKSLWDLWNDDNFVLPAERRRLDEVEPFDEWEEFALFAGHYFLLNAWTKDACVTEMQQESGFGLREKVNGKVEDEIQGKVDSPYKLSYRPNPQGSGRRRYGAICSVDANTFIHCGGFGSQRRLNNCDVYSRRTPAIKMPTLPLPLMCHTINKLVDENYMLVGGRASPDSASEACFLSSGEHWTQASALPSGRYRHCAVPVILPDSEEPGLLIFGGITSSAEVLDEWLIWTASNGWERLDVQSHSTSSELSCGIAARFGASMTLDHASTSTGYLAGGIGCNRTIVNDVWSWQLIHDNKLEIRRREDFTYRQSVCRFGATMIHTLRGLFIIGGISQTGVLRRFEEIIEITGSHDKLSNFDLEGPRPLLIGASVANFDGRDVMIVGGGAVCFSFGTYWNEGSYVLRDWNSEANGLWMLVEQAVEDEKLRRRVFIHDAPSDSPTAMKDRPDSSGKHSQELKSAISEGSLQRPGAKVPRTKITTAEDFQKIVDMGKPVILEGLDLGSCTDIWTCDYLKAHVEPDRRVVVHAATSMHMDFLSKNFAYNTMAFASFIEAIQRGERMYLRALSTKKPTAKSTNFWDDFPSLASDFKLPSALQLVSETAHSSPLRLSGPVRMWLHYDVMANVLCQIRGLKRLLLFPPSDVSKLGILAGASSSHVDVFEDSAEITALLANTRPHEALLHAGDVLFIPPLWLHSASPTDGVSIAVNVFFRTLKSGYAAGKDVYGNRDLQAYENGRRDIQRIVKSLEALPGDAAKFYISRLAAELMEAAEAWE